MQLLVLILNKTECLDELFEELMRIGVRGATVLESTGMARMIGKRGETLFESIRLLIDMDRQSNLTVIMAVDEEMVNQVRTIIDEVVGGIERPDTGVLFGLPINFFDGRPTKKSEAPYS